MLFLFGTDRTVLDQALAAIQTEAGLTTTVIDTPRTRADEGPDALVEIEGPHGTTRFAVELKTTARWEAIQHAWTRRRYIAEDALLLVAPYFTPQVAKRCRDLGICFADAVGNMFLKGPGLHVFVTGKRPPADWQVGKDGRAITPAGLRIVFALLCEPQLLNHTYRELANAARVGLGTVGPVIKDLENRRHVTAAAVRRRILDLDRLFLEWIAAFPTILRPKLNPRRFRAPNPDWTHQVPIRTYRGFWGGEVAANRLLHYLRPQITTIYVEEDPRRLIIDHRLRTDVNGDVEILDVFWNTQRIHGINDVVPPVLAYADLFTTTEGRDVEAAKMIYEQHIRPAFETQR
jgi:hypothetical protein